MRLPPRDFPVRRSGLCCNPRQGLGYQTDNPIVGPDQMHIPLWCWFSYFGPSSVKMGSASPGGVMTDASPGPISANTFPSASHM